MKSALHPDVSKLHLGHFAFIRSVIQGLDVHESWSRCFGPEAASADLRAIRSQITRIREAFAVAARREGRFGTARLVLIDPATVASEEAALPSLEDFAEQHGLQDFSEQEQLAAYEEAFGRATLGARRRARIISRQLDAIQWLETVVSQPPRAQDKVDAWINRAQAARLEEAGLGTLGALIEHINRKGSTWHDGIPSLGVAKAGRIRAWLEAHADTIGLPLDSPPQVSTSGGSDAPQLTSHSPRPLDEFVIPPSLRSGTFASSDADPTSPLVHVDDKMAITQWLESKRRSLRHPLHRDGPQHAQRAYRREAERFLLWAVIERSKVLASVDSDDCMAYQQFLADPQPRARWCGERSASKSSVHWRPFEGPLSTGAQRQAVTILRNLFRYLADHGLRMGNPWAGLEPPASTGPSVNVDRSFTPAQWRTISAELDGRRQTATHRRLGLGLRWLYATGARLSELTDALVDDLRPPPAATQEGSVESAPGVGAIWTIAPGTRREREVPVPADLLRELAGHLGSRGLHPDPWAPFNRGAFVLGKSLNIKAIASGDTAVGRDPRRGISASTFYTQAKAFFAHCARLLRAKDQDELANSFDAASTHWLRHSHARHAIQAGLPLEIAQHHLGHASMATTAIYADRSPIPRTDVLSAFWESAELN